MTPERELIARILAGETALYREFIERYQGLVSHIVFRMTLNTVEREDLCQEVFIKAYQNLSHFRQEAKISTWLAKIAYNTSLSHLAKKKVPLYDDLRPEGEGVDSLPGNAPSPEECASRKDTAVIVRGEIEQLPHHYRAILTLYHLEGMNYREIGEIMELPEGTVKSYLFRARKRLKEKLSLKYSKEEICG